MLLKNRVVKKTIVRRIRKPVHDSADLRSPVANVNNSKRATSVSSPRQFHFIICFLLCSEYLQCTCCQMDENLVCLFACALSSYSAVSSLGHCTKLPPGAAGVFSLLQICSSFFVCANQNYNLQTFPYLCIREWLH